MPDKKNSVKVYHMVDATTVVKLSPVFQKFFGEACKINPNQVVVTPSGFVYAWNSSIEKIANESNIPSELAAKKCAEETIVLMRNGFDKWVEDWYARYKREDERFTTFPIELKIDCSQKLTEGKKARYWRIIYRLKVSSGGEKSQKCEVYGGTVSFHIGGGAQIIGIEYNIHPLYMPKEVAKYIILDAQKRNIANDLSIVYLMDFEKKRIVPYFLRIPFEPTNYGQEQSLDNFASSIDDDKWGVSELAFVPACHLSNKLKSKKILQVDIDFFVAEYEKYYPIEASEKVIKVSNLKNFLRSIQNYYNEKSIDFDFYQLCYIIATTMHESGKTFMPVIEAYWLSEQARIKYYEEMYDPVLGKDAHRRSLAIKNENTEQGDGVKYAGRGFVQITWKSNYKKFKEILGIDLLECPELAQEIYTATAIIVHGMLNGTFTGIRLSLYVGWGKKNYEGARRVVNGTDQAKTIAEYASKIETFLRLK